MQYLGQVSDRYPEKDGSDKTNFYKLVYTFINKNMYVSEEYFIYDVRDVIGSVGGTLGMFIGFSFTGVISWMFSTILKL